MRVGFVDGVLPVMVFMFMFNVSSLPLMFFPMGFGTFLPELSLHCGFHMRGRFVVAVMFFRTWFCLGVFSTRHLRLLLGSNVGQPGYCEFVPRQLVLKRAAQKQSKTEDMEPALNSSSAAK